tara:strand:+ start:104 stop:517 length:414 start_codon:yes stop_codon:yes gene_type:complete
LNPDDLHDEHMTPLLLFTIIFYALATATALYRERKEKENNEQLLRSRMPIMPSLGAKKFDALMKGLQAQSAPSTEDWCKDHAKKYNVVVGKSWGSLPSILQTKWARLLCDHIDFSAPKSDQDNYKFLFDQHDDDKLK